MANIKPGDTLIITGTSNGLSILSMGLSLNDKVLIKEYEDGYIAVGYCTRKTLESIEKAISRHYTYIIIPNNPMLSELLKVINNG